MTDPFRPRDPAFAERVRASFARQTMMATLGATLERVEPGMVTIALPRAPHILQQHGFVHGGATGCIADSAAGYAALTLMPPGTGVLSVEFKINFLAPAAGERLVATGRVLRAGRSLSVSQAEVVADSGNGPRTVALLTATLTALQDRDGVVD